MAASYKRTPGASCCLAMEAFDSLPKFKIAQWYSQLDKGLECMEKIKSQCNDMFYLIIKFTLTAKRIYIKSCGTDLPNHIKMTETFFRTTYLQTVKYYESTNGYDIRSCTGEIMGFSLALLVEKSLMVELCYASGWKSNANVTQKGNLKRSLEKDRTATPFWKDFHSSFVCVQCTAFSLHDTALTAVSGQKLPLSGRIRYGPKKPQKVKGKVFL
ncbi:hypothetical protein F2P81_004617 [Scophthalmus maximus]|uniref:Uncharacterized protein n=1 Tax=Scophthalmus maximus TaxID=52904 RepID=A0A6A4THR6_SCOMX|nr:hypothetical protein F2P81_004617 [Scophthalmus maximus]